MKLIGLTGSIATGKSTCSKILSSPPYNLPLVDADLLARKAVEPGTWAYNRIVRRFGPTTPDLLLPASDPQCQGLEYGPTGKGRPLNRPALGRRVFGTSPEKARDRKKLNSIVHPAVRFYMFRQILWHYLMGHWAVLLDVPLLYESGLDIFCSTVVVVAVSDPAIQMHRLRERDPHLTEDDARNRVASQTDVREKAKRAENRNFFGQGRGYVLYNDAGREELELQIAEMVREIRSGCPAWWNLLLWLWPPLMIFVVFVEIIRGRRIKRKQDQERGAELPKTRV